MGLHLLVQWCHRPHVTVHCCYANFTVTATTVPLCNSAASDLDKPLLVRLEYVLPSFLFFFFLHCFPFLWTILNLPFFGSLFLGSDG